MNAAIVQAPAGIGKNPLRVVEVPVPHAGPGQVLLRVRACGVCRTGLHLAEGANMTRADARDFLDLAAKIALRPHVTVFPLAKANEALAAIKNDSIDGSAVIVP